MSGFMQPYRDWRPTEFVALDGMSGTTYVPAEEEDKDEESAWRGYACRDFERALADRLGLAEEDVEFGYYENMRPTGETREHR